MKLRTQILLVLLMFALLPILVTVITNLPRVLELLGSFHRQVYLQEMRSDFRDLDQHLASRQEMLKLLAKLPEPGLMLGQSDQEDDDQSDIDVARTHYIEWINRILPDQLDIIEILFLDQQGNLRFWLERNAEKHNWEPTLVKPLLPPDQLMEKTFAASQPEVNFSRVRIRVDAKEKDPRRFMNLHLSSPLGFIPGGGASGAVFMAVDIGGMARRFSDTFWAYDDGRYLEVSRQAETGRTAFDDFPGIAKLFPSGKLFLWQGGDGRQVIWVPLIQTESSGPLWVGRTVDASPLVDFRSQLILRIGGIILVLMIIAWIVARWFALRADRVGYELTEGISRLLEDDEKVVFTWRWTNELKLLGQKLTSLARKHVSNTQRIRSHTRELEESNRYKSQFLANVSHELRTPLNSIVLLSKILADKESGLAEDNAKQARVIHQAGRDLQALIDDILDLSKIEAGHSSLNLENIELQEILNNLVALMKPQFDARGLYLKLIIDPDVTTHINTDTDKLRQIVKNFLSNAVKFTDSGGVTMRLMKSEGKEAESLPVCISVKDTGIGIAKNKHDLVFQAFKQADGSTSRRYGGTGLGLSISRELAHLLGGEIELHSEENQGADFRLLLPLVFDRERIEHEQVGIDEPAIEPEEMQQLESDMHFENKQALLIDDDVKNLLALTMLLEKWGFKVTGAGDADEALEALAEEQFDIILIDIMMPAMDGYATMKKIRQDYACGTVPIIALSSQADNKEREACLDGGANEYLAKPVATDALKSVLIDLLEG